MLYSASSITIPLLNADFFSMMLVIIFERVDVLIMAKSVNTLSFLEMRKVSCLGPRDVTLTSDSYYLPVLP